MGSALFGLGFGPVVPSFSASVGGIILHGALQRSQQHSHLITAQRSTDAQAPEGQHRILPRRGVLGL